MSMLTTCQARSPPAVESPPRKKFKFSLKLKAKKKPKPKNPMESDSEGESMKENGDSTMNSESKRPVSSPVEKSTNDLTEANTTFGFQVETVTPPLPYTGLTNLGNTCYLNAVLQVLRFCPEFLTSLANLDEICAQNCAMDANVTSEGDNLLGEDLLPSSRPSIIHSIHKLTSAMKKAEENYGKFGLEANEVKNRSGWTTLAVRPQDFVRDFSGLCPLFSGYQQHDAQEFLRSFLGLVEDECVGLVKGEQQGIVKVGTNLANNNDSKVRGGCKYPSTIINGVIKTEELPTMAMTTDISTSSQPNCDEGWNDGLIKTNLYTATPKSLANCKPTSSESVNLVKRLFEGTLLLQTCCLTCEGIRQRHENFQDISVPVQNKKKSSSDWEHGNSLSDSEDESDREINLSWAISKFASVERLNGDNKYFCDNCATLTEADISTYFEKLPRVLTIHLKRFQTSYGNQNLYTNSWVTKVTRSLHTPQQLSLKKWCSETCSEKDAVYRLFGVVMHNGMSSCSGHYLSYVNVDIFKKNADGRGKVNAEECSGAVQCEVVRNSGHAMEVDDSCLSTIDQCYSTEVPSMNGHKYRRNQRVKCGSTQSSATKVTNIDSKANDEVSKSHACKARDCESNSSGGMCDEKTTFDGQSNLKNGRGESEDLCCEKRVGMEVDNEDTNLEPLKDTSKQNQIPRRANINDVLGKDVKFKGKGIHSGRDAKDGGGSGNSSDEEEAASASFTRIPCSMDITRFFKPIPKSGSCKTKSRVNVEISDQSCTPESNHAPLDTRSSQSSGQEGGNDSQPTDSVDCSTSTSFQMSHDSAFDTIKKNDLSPKVRSSCEPTSSCGQTSNNDDLPTCGSDSKSFTKSSAQIEPCDELCSNDSPSADEFVKVDTGVATLQDQAITSADIKHYSVPNNAYSNETANDKGTYRNNTQNSSNSQPSNSQGFTPVSDGKSFQYEDCSIQSNIDSSERPISTSTWLKFDDAEVQEISAKDMEEILSQSSSCYSTPYLLFYYQC
ncbi:uncharacterized protein LOC114529018 [Dendronephthya gigantea]|uniref:uncharacterized protein LOC114529018 n=1 Tax=Dendronephthya gigantea TaxID=151771 RepID=UPI00106A25EE|nr:uncharacterized protein LOC114529018 [Dendronephthya gigantea]